MPASLIITVDTEEEGLWGGRFPRTGNTVENVLGIERFQEVCNRFGIRPTYLVDAPVIEEDWAVDLLKGIQDGGRAEIGAHLHPWCNPPFDEEITARNSYMCNLPEGLQRAKLAWLTERIEERFGRRPTAFRAGRYGLDIVGARILSQLGYLADSSVIPFTDYSPQGGPDFRDAPWTPYWVGGEDLCFGGNKGQGATDTREEAGHRHHTPDHQVPDHRPLGTRPLLLELPVSVGYSRPNFQRADRLRTAAMHPVLRRLHCVGILDRLGLARRIKFSPEQASVRHMKQLVDAYVAQQTPCMVLMLHSTSLMPGGSPYVRSRVDLDRLYCNLTDLFEVCVAQQRLVNTTLSGFARVAVPSAAPGKGTCVSNSLAAACRPL